jgi:hypothetical protein
LQARNRRVESVEERLFVFLQITLGTVDGAAAGGKLFITKFDTDIGSTSITYTCSSLPNQQFAGVLSGNDETTTDTIDIPKEYKTGVWTASYAAGTQDTSVWDMSYIGVVPGRPGMVRLIGSPGKAY